MVLYCFSNDTEIVVFGSKLTENLEPPFTIELMKDQSNNGCRGGGLGFNPEVRNSRAGLLFWCCTYRPDPCFYSSDVIVMDEHSYSKTSSQVQNSFSAHIVSSTRLYFDLVISKLSNDESDFTRLQAYQQDN